MIALPSDVARASPRIKAADRGLLEAMVGIFAAGLAATYGDTTHEARR